jgi:hypothetical protein
MSSEQKLDQILSKLEDIERRLKRVEESCVGMDGHIGFVESVYGTLRSPLDFLANQVNRISGTAEGRLPSPQIKQLKHSA